MGKYCLKRFLQSLVTIFVVVSIVFLLLRLMRIEGYFPPGSLEKMSPETQMAYLQKLGLFDEFGEPINPFVQLGRYYVRIIGEGSLGESTQLYQGREIWPLIQQRIPISLAVSLTGLVLGLALGYALGIAMAQKKDKLVDAAGMAYIVIITAVPNLVIYLLAQYWVTKWLGTSMIYRAGNWLTLFTPVLCTALITIGSTALWMRRFMVDEMNRDYVKLAYAKGLPGNTVMYRHVMRNAFVPMAYSLPVSFVFALSGSLIIERQFSIPGMGRLLVDSINRRDNNFVQALIILYASMGIFSVFLGDLLATVVDPRISLVSKGGGRQ
jgi:oligopeptide transport system permease protein